MEIPASKTRRGLPIAASLFGLIGLLELGWVWIDNINASPCGRPLTDDYFSIPSLLGFTLGLIAIRKNNREAPISLAGDVNPATLIGWRGLAILGVVVSIPGLLLTIASFRSCGLEDVKVGRESAALQTLRTIHIIQAQYSELHSRFATLEEMAAGGMIDAVYASGRPISGYVYSSSDVTAETYCAHANRANDKCGSRDFIVCEDGVIRFVESETKGAVSRGEGKPLGGASR
ncbi:MAG: hypothetical protein MOB07_30390 [Acidobacteria bacterium]|nr:hypothetical protein [Acidobacteriota bacterium]